MGAYVGVPMNVLIGCESSGVVREAFRRRGHDAYSCDLRPAADGSQWHIQDDVFVALAARAWDLFIVHPPCTYLCSSGLHWNVYKPGRKYKIPPDQRAMLTEESLEFVQRLMAAKVPKIAVENPQGCIGTRIRKSDQVVQPYQFGDDASKATHLWLKGLPKLVLPPASTWVEPRWICCGQRLDMALVGRYGCPFCHGERQPRPRWANQTDSGQNRLGPSADRWSIRSVTYPGIAEAMAAQWGGGQITGQADLFTGDVVREAAQ